MRVHGGIAALVAASVALACGTTPAGAQVAQDGEAVLVPPTAAAPGLAVSVPDEPRTPGELCVRALLPVEPGDAGIDPLDAGAAPGSQACGDPTRSDARALVLADAARRDPDAPRPRGAVLAGLVPAGAARVVLRTRDGSTQVLPATPTPAPGAPGPLAGRVAAVVAPATVPPADVVEARVERADGTALGVASLGGGSDRLGGIVSGPPTIRSVSTRAGTLAVRTSVESTLLPTAAALERRVAGTCTSITLGGRPLGPVTRCAQDAAVDDGLTASAAICRADRVVLSGVLAPGRTSGTALLADGRRRAVDVTAADVLPGRRGWSLVAPPGVGVRRLLDVPVAAGSGAGLAPAAVHCALEAHGEQQTSVQSTYADTLRFVHARQAVVPGAPARLATAPGGVPLLAVDGPVGTICLGLGAAPRVGGCTDVGRDPSSVGSFVSRPTADGGELVAGVAKATVAQVQVRTTSRERVRVATAPAGGAYAGAYAGTLRTFAVRLPRGRVALEASASVPAPPREGSDGILGYLSVPDRAALRVRRIAELPGGLHLDATGGTARTTSCVGITSGPRPTSPGLDCLVASGRDGTSVAVSAPCSARRIVLAAVLEGRSAALRVVDDRGRAHVGRRFALRGRDVVHVVVLPRGRAPRAMTTSGTSGPDLRRRGLPVPAATRQCGWSDGATRSAPPTGANPDITQLR